MFSYVPRAPDPCRGGHRGPPRETPKLVGIPRESREEQECTNQSHSNHDALTTAHVALGDPPTSGPTYCRPLRGVLPTRAAAPGMWAGGQAATGRALSRETTSQAQRCRGSLSVTPSPNNSCAYVYASFFA